MEESLRRQAVDTGASNVHFVGAVDDKAKNALLGAACGFVFPATQRSEAFGLALLEGAIAGLPLVSTELGTGTSYVNRDGETGIVVAPNDRTGLVAALNSIVGSPELAKRYGDAARRRYETMFTATLMGKSYYEIYRDLVGQSKD